MISPTYILDYVFYRITTIGAAGEWNGATHRCRVRIGRQKVSNLYLAAMTFFV